MQRLSKIRMEEAGFLLSHGRWSGAYYLAGYSAECALKACIAKATAEFDFPDKDRVNASFSHDLIKLLATANLSSELDTHARANLDFDSNWKIAQAWSEKTRYRLTTEAQAKALIDALANAENGILPWLELHW